MHPAQLCLRKDKEKNSRKLRRRLGECGWDYWPGREDEAGDIVSSSGEKWESRNFRKYNQDKLGLYNNKLKCILVKNLVTAYSK